MPVADLPAPDVQTERLEALHRRMLTDQVFYAKNCLKIVDQQERESPLVAKPAQLRFEEIAAEQERQGKPVRIIVLKARKEGISTWTQGRMIKRATTRENHKALVVAHDGDTAEEIFAIGETMYSKLPDEIIGSQRQLLAGEGLVLKPPVLSTRSGEGIQFGEPNARKRLEGALHLNSSYYVDTANEYEAGRGFTYHSLHVSEMAFFKSAETKMKALLNAVPDTPNTMIVIESTANGYNLFRRYWMRAEAGLSGFAPLFIPWYEDPAYRQEFETDEEKQEFFAALGTGEFGEAEPELLELGCDLEQLKWRRWAIENKCNGDLRDFWQEYPAKPEEAFLSAGRQVFQPARVQKVMERAELSDPTAVKGVLKAQAFDAKTYMGREVQVPKSPLWVPDAEVKGVATPRWMVWENPDPGEDERPELELPARPPGQYVMFIDSSSGRETASEGTDYMAIQVINQRTRAQVAVYHAREVDADVVCDQAYLFALLYKTAWLPIIGVEITGGYGLAIANKLHRVYHYPNLYWRRPAEQKGEKENKLLGWSTDQKTKPLIVDNAKELVRKEIDGIRHLGTVQEMLTYVRDDKGKMGAEEDFFDDLVESWMGAQYIANETPLRRPRRPEDAVANRRVPRAPSMRLRPSTTRYRR